MTFMSLCFNFYTAKNCSFSSCTQFYQYANLHIRFCWWTEVEKDLMAIQWSSLDMHEFTVHGNIIHAHNKHKSFGTRLLVDVDIVKISLWYTVSYNPRRQINACYNVISSHFFHLHPHQDEPSRGSGSFSENKCEINCSSGLSIK